MKNKVLFFLSLILISFSVCAMDMRYWQPIEDQAINGIGVGIAYATEGMGRGSARDNATRLVISNTLFNLSAQYLDIRFPYCRNHQDLDLLFQEVSLRNQHLIRARILPSLQGREGFHEPTLQGDIQGRLNVLHGQVGLRVQFPNSNSPQQQCRPNPDFPPFFSTQNLNKFLSDCSSGMGPGLIGGTIGLVIYLVAKKVADAYWPERILVSILDSLVKKAELLQKQGHGSLHASYLKRIKNYDVNGVKQLSLSDGFGGKSSPLDTVEQLAIQFDDALLSTSSNKSQNINIAMQNITNFYEFVRGKNDQFNRIVALPA